MSRKETPFKPSQFGRYLLEERLAIGGMAEIFRAKIQGMHGFEKTCVIKRILPHLAEDQEFVDLFIDEAQVMVRLNHPKVVQVHDFGEVDGQYYIAMEYVEGLDALELLRECAKRKVRPTTGIAVHIVSETLDALDFAHRLVNEHGKSYGIVHRDVSPSNIFISDMGEIKLGDFGIAWAKDRRGHTEHGALRGKYGYMSPEQVAGKPVDGRSDVFAAGIVLAELLMIRRLFLAKSDLEILLQVRDARLDRLYKHGHRIPDDLRLILESALARDQSLRYQTAGDFRDALHRYLFDNRRMIRSVDVRRFLGRLRGSKQVLRTSATYAQVPPKSDSETAAGRPARAGKPDSNKRRPVAPTVAAKPSAVSAVDSPAVGRKRRIQLEPPASPEPVPVGLSQTGEAPRLATEDALAALPEMRQSSTGSGGEFNSQPSIDPPQKPPPARLAEIESEASVASRLTHEVTGVLATEPDEKGSLSDRSLFTLLFHHAVEEHTGLIVLSQDGSFKEIYLVDGDPHFVSSNQAEELFGQYLLSRGVLSEGELSMALAMLPHFNGRLGDTLVALKLLRPMEVLRHLTHQVRLKLLDAFAWLDGEFQYFDGRRCERESAPLGLDAFELIGAAATQLDGGLVNKRLQRVANERLQAVVPPPVPPEVFRLGDGPRRAFDQLTGAKTLQQLLASFSDEERRREFARMTFMLVETGLAVSGSA